jgi:hypothetical protein
MQHMGVYFMKRNIRKNNQAVFAVLIIMLLAVIIPASAYEMNIALDKTYKFKLANVSTINSTDLGDLSQSRVEVLTTNGAGTDIQTIHTPVFRQVTRDFASMSGTFNGVIITITGANPSTVDLTTKPDFKIYTQPSVPTFSISAPGRTGNPVVTKYNESWTKEDTGSLSSLFRSSEGAYMYKTLGLLHVNTTNNEYTTSGVWSSGDYDKDNVTFTLDRNKVSLDPFVADSATSFNMGFIYPQTLADTGKYFAGAMLHNEAEKNLKIYAMYPIVVLKAPTPIRWTNASGSFTSPPFAYVVGSADDVTLNFTGSNPDLPGITKVTYLFINDSVQYDMYLHIDTHLLAQKAETRWQTSFSPSTQVIDLLYDGIQNDVGTPFNYTMTAVGFPDPAPSTEWSTIAITPGFGISGKANGDTVTVPAANMSALDPGLYDLYLMGTDAHNNIVALDQVQVRVIPPHVPTTEIGVFRNGVWYLDYNANGWWDGPVTDRKYLAFGVAGDIPAMGDWNNDGITEIGVFRNGAWYLDYNGNSWWDGPVTDRLYPAFGIPGDKPAMGDWNNDGTTEIGVFRNGVADSWYLDYNGNGWWDGPVTDRRYPAFGIAGDMPFTGNWSGDRTTEIGVMRNGVYNRWFLDYNGNGWWDGSVTDRLYPAFGITNDKPVSADWNHDATTEVGVFRYGTYDSWYLDYNGNGWWDGPVTDRVYPAFGITGDLPITGIW